MTPEDWREKAMQAVIGTMDDLMGGRINEAYGQLLKAQYALDRLRGRKRAAKVKAMLTVAKH